MVIIIIGILAGVAMKSMTATINTSRIESTKKEMEQLASAIVGNQELISNGVRVDFGYVGDIGSLPHNLDALVNRPGGYATWKGPYIRNSFNQASEDYKRDAWNTLYTYTGGVTIISTGSGSNITKQYANSVSDLTGNTIQGVVLDANSNPPGSQNGNVSMIITYPDGAGSTTSSSVNPSTNGNYSFAGIPIGNQTIRAINSPTNDTLISYVTVLPKSTIINNMKFGSSIWQASGASSGNSLEYVSGSASTNHSSDVQFDIYNNTGAGVTVDWLNASYSHTPAAYYDAVMWGHTAVANTYYQRYASGTQVNFNASKTINNGSTVTIQLQHFVDRQNGGGYPVNMTGTTFTVTFSDSSVVIFSL